MKRIIILLLLFSLFQSKAQQGNNDFVVMAYYAGQPETIDSFEVEKLTHIIFSFCHLKGNRLFVDNARDSLTIQKMVRLKKRNPTLKVYLSLGGWGGCETCSPIFASKQNRVAFARSVKKLMDYFHTDGIDLDWEYPAIEGYPGHQYLPADKANFTDLVRELRKSLGKNIEITFAAGGFTKFLQESIEWKKIMPLLNKVNLMTYDLVNGYSKVTGHHTPLYSTPHQIESTDNVIRFLDSIGVPRNKLVIGAAFYGRMWENVPDINNGLYQSGDFKMGISYRDFRKMLSKDSGYQYFRDPIAKAPYIYNSARKQFVTYDDEESLKAKTKYALDKKLNGIMFWQLAEDSYRNGLVEAIHSVVRTYKH